MKEHTRSLPEVRWRTEHRRNPRRLPMPRKEYLKMEQRDITVNIAEKSEMLQNI
jgi:hypothetical protein